MAKAAVDLSDVQTFDMTPMIDIVFQLVVFLMIANDMGAREIEDLVLPKAPNGIEDLQTGEKRRIIVNLLANKGTGPPTLKVHGMEMDLDKFKQILQPEADLSREKDANRASDLFILIRADAASRWQDVQWVMQACADAKIRIYKLQFATTNPNIQERR
jgi:biopolymer transport protein ExbD